jgi:hypothetical protein
MIDHTPLSLTIFNLVNRVLGVCRDDTIPATDIQVARRPDGSPIVLGKGSFGEVRPYDKSMSVKFNLSYISLVRFCLITKKVSCLWLIPPLSLSPSLSVALSGSLYLLYTCLLVSGSFPFLSLLACLCPID